MKLRRVTIVRFAASRDAVSAIEFALTFPVLLIVMLAGFQIVLYVNATRHVENIAASISEMISQASPPDNSTTVATVNQVDLNFGYDATVVLFPFILKDSASKNVPWRQDISVNFSSIQFKSNGKTCPSSGDQSTCYTANVVWTSTGVSGGNYRPCTPAQSAQDDSAPPIRSALPQSIFNAGSIIAVDVAFTFVPTFGKFFLPTITIARSVFIQPRYATLINFDTANNDGIASKCS